MILRTVSLAAWFVGSAVVAPGVGRCPEAARIISSADTFSTLTGATGCLTDPAQGFVLLFRARDVDAFRILANQPSVSARLYGLCGLKHLGAQGDAAALRKRLLSSRDRVAIEMGCEGPGPVTPLPELLTSKDG